MNQQKNKKNSKDKGATYEREIANILKKYGYAARRTAQYCGNTGDASDVIGLPGIHIECKHYKDIGFKYEWLNQAISESRNGDIPAVFHRTDRHPNIVTLTIEDFLALYEMAFSKQNNDTDDDDYILENERIPDLVLDSDSFSFLLKNVFGYMYDLKMPYAQAIDAATEKFKLAMREEDEENIFEDDYELER